MLELGFVLTESEKEMVERKRNREKRKRGMEKKRLEGCRGCLLRSDRKKEMSEKKKKKKLYERKKKKETVKKEEEEEEENGVILENFCLTEEEQKKRIVLMCMEKGVKCRLKMIRTNPHRGFLFKDTTPVKKDFPSDLLELNDYGMVALESKLYFIGGYHPGSDSVSKKVFVYDTLSSKWYPGHPLNVARANPTVVTYGRKICVFGFPVGYPESISDESISPQHWAEYYDLDCGGSWKYLPGDDLPEDLLKGYSLVIPVVIEKHHTILLCVQGIAVYRYSFDDEKWFRMIKLAFSPSALFWSHTVVVASDILFWHHYGTIYAYDFQPNSTPIPLLTLPDAVQAFGEPDGFGDDAPESFLFHAGNGKLCLIYKCPFPPYEGVIRCHTFQLQHSRTTKRLTLNQEGYHSFPSEDYEMFTVLTT